MDEKDRLNKMARLVFNKGNIQQMRDGINSLLDVYMTVVDQPFQHGSCFSHDDVMDRLEKIEQKQWRPIRNMMLLDPFYGYVNGEFNEEENESPAKLTIDFISVLDGVSKDMGLKLQEYKNIVNTLSKEKQTAEVALAKAEGLLREERSLFCGERTELKTSRGSVLFLEGVVKDKNERIAELQREGNVQLWEREKERLFIESDKKITKLESELKEKQRQIEVITKKLVNMDETNKMLRMKSDLNKGVIPPSENTKTSEEFKRAIYLLEKDVIFLEQQIYNQQRTFATVLYGLKTDLLIISDNLTDPDTGQVKDKDFVRVCDITNLLHNGMLEGDISDTQKQLPPHYAYLPSNFKVKRVKRVSRSNLPPIRASQPMDSEDSVAVHNLDLLGENMSDDPIVENPVLIDPVSKEVSSTQCMKNFPHMAQDFIKEHWIKFKEFDQDGNECLDFTEVVKALTAMGMQFTAQQAEEAMREADVNKSRTLDFYEYLLVADKLFSKKGHSELFHIGAAKNNSKFMAKTCVVQ